MTTSADGRYSFGPYVLDVGEQSLHRDGRVVRLPPRAFDTLRLLVERHGHLVTKDELFTEVWGGTAVEDNNLTQQISILRRTLNGDGAVQIETVPKRGYRLLATVELVANGLPALSPGRDTKERPSVRARLAGWLVAAMAAAALGSALWVPTVRPRAADTTSELTPLVTRATNLGSVVRAAISGDGRTVAYAVASGARESLWVKAIDAASPAQLIEPAVGTFRRGGGLTLAPDGRVYYTWFRPDLSSLGIYRISVQGGRPEPLPNVWDLPAFDPAGKRFACITTTSSSIRDSRLLVYDAASGSPRVIAMRAPPETFLQVKPAWSPDGLRLAAWTMSARTPGLRHLVSVDVASGREQVVTSQPLHAVDGMVWLPDGSSVIVAARERASSPLRLWQIPLDAPVMRPLTRDISDYLLAGVTGDGHRLAAVRVEVARSLWVSPVTDVARARQVGSDAGELAGVESLAWMPDGRVLYTSAESGNADIWILDPVRGIRRQLTTSPHDDFNPAPTADGRTIVFASDRSGMTGLWAMPVDGDSQARQLTGHGDSRPTVSADGWVVFQRGVIQSSPIDLWRVRLDGGPAVQLAEGTRIRPAVSPDGRLVAHYWLTPERWALAVLPVDGDQRAQVWPLSPTHCGRTVRWSPDSRALAYVDCAGGVANIWLRRLDGSPARRLTSFTSGHIDTFDWSRDGSQLAWLRRSEVSDLVLIDLATAPPRS